MIGSTHIAIGAARLSPAIALALAMLCVLAPAQQPSHAPVPAAAPVQPPPARPAASSSPLGEEVSLDRVVAIVNGDLILESDIDEEERFAAFQPFSGESVSRDGLIDRLIDRAVILQQMALQPGTPISDADVDAELSTLRKSIPACATYHCDTQAGWVKFVSDHGFTLQELHDRWRLRMEVLQFIEDRFRAGIFDTITPAQVDQYYQKTMIPAYQKQKVTPPPESTVADRIQEILLQQQVNKLLDDWLTSLRAQGSVRILKPGEEAP
jgi:peptidyl-prolyl cis-trans isomerase SurA